MCSTAHVCVCCASQVLYAPCGPELLGKVPSRSIVAQEAVGNGLVTELVALLGVGLPEFVYNHPGGAIGASGGGASA